MERGQTQAEKILKGITYERCYNCDCEVIVTTESKKGREAAGYEFVTLCATCYFAHYENDGRGVRPFTAEQIEEMNQVQRGLSELN